MTKKKYNSSVTDELYFLYCIGHKTKISTRQNINIKPTSIRCLPLVPPISADLQKFTFTDCLHFLQILTKYFFFVYLNCSKEVTAGTVGTLSKTGPAVGTAEGRWNPWLPTEGPWPLVAAVKRSKLAASGLEAATPAAEGPVSWKVRAGRSRKDCGGCWDSCCKLPGCCCCSCCCCAGCRGRKENCCSEVTAPCKRHTNIVVYYLTIIGVQWASLSGNEWVSGPLWCPPLQSVKLTRTNAWRKPYFKTATGRSERLT